VSAIGDDLGGLDELAAARLAEGRAILAGLVSDRNGLIAAATAGCDEDMLTSRGWKERADPGAR
jgi:hypothetical protein